MFMPAYSPELQPAERLWPLTNEGVANKCAGNIGAIGVSAISALPSLAESLWANSWINPLPLVASKFVVCAINRI